MWSDCRTTRAVELTTFIITFALAVTTLGAVGNALAKRNHEVGEATRLAAAARVHLIVATNQITQPGYALCAAACCTIVNTLTLIILSIKIPVILRKFLWFVFLFAVFDALFLLATCIAVLYNAKRGHLTLYGTIGSLVLPQSVLKEQAASLGLTDAFWGKGYVRFMAIVSVPTTSFAISTAGLAYGWWRRERSATHTQQSPSNNPGFPHVTSNDEKGRRVSDQV
ncbi:hypothetical protein IAR55_004215 [Kwoniella newhampshirensis]|uniref:MARVEL domain-containing protein n=1 Tax=Kwoniella newhampshirensis TaxID=1651941 RepID=A0AAW0YQB8_9TREE